MRQIVLDTETTGLSADTGDRIIEIGCVELVARKLTGNNKHFYLNPERDSHEDALKVHGISNEFLKDKPKFSAVAQELLDYLQDAEVIIHNAPFDLSLGETDAFCQLIRKDTKLEGKRTSTREPARSGKKKPQPRTAGVSILVGPPGVEPGTNGL